MIGASLNCRGVGKKGMGIFLADLIKDQQLDFIGLQETIKKDYSPAFFRRIDPGGNFVWKWFSSVGRSGGILGGFRLSRFTICDTSVGRFHIKVTLMNNFPTAVSQIENLDSLKPLKNHPTSANRVNPFPSKITM
jgi:hypothetical protein